MARQDQANDQFSAHLVPLWRQCRLYRGSSMRATRTIRQSVERNGRISSAPAGRCRRCHEERRGRVLERSRTGRSQANGELVSALDGNWGIVEKHIEKKVKDKAAADGAAHLATPTCMQATRDSVRAIMMIRAYRMRGHLHADLDPLGLAKPLEDYNELSPESLRLHRGRLRPQDLHRQCARARIRDHPRRCSRS